MKDDLYSSKISIHHIGGRNGTKSFPRLRCFEKDFVNVLYDADTECIEHAKASNQDSESEIYVLPYCFGDVLGKTTININYDPFTSSLKDFDETYGTFYYYSVDHDYVYSEVCTPMEKREVELTTIDSVYNTAQIKIQPPDFLSIDTQGSEYEILMGAEDNLKDNIIAIVAEVEFHPIYKDQKLFGDLVAFLGERGFDFVKFTDDLQMASPYRAPIGIRGEGFQMCTDALFLRRVSDIEKLECSDKKRKTMLQKLAFISMVYNQFEYGLLCLKAAGKIDNINNEIDAEKPGYIKFIEELEAKIEVLPEVFPQTFILKYSFKESKGRFDINGGKKAIAITVNVPKSIFEGYSDIEMCFVKYGMEEQANLLKKNRIHQTIVNSARQNILAKNPDIEKDNVIVQYKFNMKE